MLRCVCRFGAAFGAVVLLSAIPAKADPTWTGFYVGAHAGYGWADWDGKLETTAGCSGTCPDFDPNDPFPSYYTSGFADPNKTLSDAGWFGGGQIGFNWQMLNGVVIGLEGDVSWADINAGGTFDTDPNYKTSIWSKKHDLSLDYFGTARVRVGYAVGDLLPYVTGGLAWGHTEGDLAVTYIPPAGVGGTSYASTDETHVGWALGGGVEWALGQHWSLKAEYLHMDLGEQEYLFKGHCYCKDQNGNFIPFNTDSFRSDLTLDTVRVGVNYKLDSK